jgi:hypothetical protein
MNRLLEIFENKFDNASSKAVNKLLLKKNGFS